MADIEERSITRVQQRHNFQANRFLYHVATNTRGRIRPVSIAAQIPQVVVRRRLRRGWSAHDAVNTSFNQEVDELLRSLLYYWRLNETSGVRVATFGGINLNPTADIGSVAGKNGNAASFDEGEYLQSASEILLTRPFTLAFWMYIPTGASFEDVAFNHTDGTNSRTLNVFDNTDVTFFNGRVSGFGEVFTSFSYDTWNFYVFTIAANGQMKHSRNGETLNVGPVCPQNDPASSVIQVGSPASPGSFCRIDSLMMFNRDISQAEVARLYNSGAGYFP